MSLQQTNYENIVAKGETAHYIVILSFTEISPISVYIFSKSPAADLLYVGKG